MPEMNADAGNTQTTGTDATAATTANAEVNATQPSAPAEPTTRTEAPAAEVAKTAPDKYEFVQPDGQALPEALTASVESVARELNLPQAEAQKLIDKLAPAMAQHNADTLVKVQAEWKQQLAADKDIGGDKLEENKAIAAKVFTDFGDPELGAFLEKTGLGDNPFFVKWAYRVGKAISEDRAVPGTRKPGSAEANPEQRVANSLYGKTSA